MENSEHLVKCECNGCYLRVSKIEKEPFVYLEKFTASRLSLRFYDRIKLALGFIFQPEKYDIHGGVVLSSKNGRDLGVKLLALTRSNAEGEDIEVGQ